MILRCVYTTQKHYKKKKKLDAGKMTETFTEIEGRFI